MINAISGKEYVETLLLLTGRVEVMNSIAMTIYFVCFLWLLSGIDQKLKAILEELKNRRKDDKNNEN